MDTGMYKLRVTFDSNTEVESNLQFEYLPDPVIISTEPAELKSINRYVTLKLKQRTYMVDNSVMKLYNWGALHYLLKKNLLWISDHINISSTMIDFNYSNSNLLFHGILQKN